MTGQDPSPDPMTVLGEGMATLHEIYLSAISAGFTEQQAMTIILRLAVDAMKNEPGAGQ